MALGVAGTTLLDELNRLANSGTYRAASAMVGEALAAKQWATVLSISTNLTDTVGILNAIQGTTSNNRLDFNGVCNAIAGTTQLPAAQALRAVDVVLSTPTIELIVVAGGGGSQNAGGGAGGLSYQAARSIATGTPYTVTIGAGGASSAVNGSTAAIGSNSIFDTITSNGGGFVNGSGLGQTGGSGGGSYAGNNPAGVATQGNTGGATGFGNNGGRGGNGTADGGGGGGAGAVGNAFQVNGSNNGGVGLEYWNQNNTATYYAGGGGGYNYGTATPGTGGLGGGGTGTSGGAIGSGTVNTGGGGGAAITRLASQSGGSGVVVLRYSSSYNAATSTTGSPTVNIAGGYRYYKFTGSGSITF